MVGRPIRLHLLGAHVQRGAHGHAAGGNAQGPIEAARQAEVGDLHLAGAADQDVLGFDVAMDDVQLAGALQGGRDLGHHPQPRGDGYRFSLFNKLAKVAALDVFQGHEVVAGGLPDRVDLHDVGVRGAGDCLRLGLEARQ